MCRPNYSSLLLSENIINKYNLAIYKTKVYDSIGEGSHRNLINIHHLYSKHYITKIDSVIYSSSDLYVGDEFIETKDLKTLESVVVSAHEYLPFECFWDQSPLVGFQPNGGSFYKFKDLPTENDYKIAQEYCDKAIGNIDKLFNWLKQAFIICKNENDEYSIFPESIMRYNIIHKNSIKDNTLLKSLSRLVGTNYNNDKVKVLGNEKTLESDLSILKDRYYMYDEAFLFLDYYYDKATSDINNLPEKWKERELKWS